MVVGKSNRSPFNNKKTGFSTYYKYWKLPQCKGTM